MEPVPSLLDLDDSSSRKKSFSASPKTPSHKNAKSLTPQFSGARSTPSSSINPPPLPPKDSHLLKLAPRSSRAEPLSFVDTSPDNEFYNSQLSSGVGYVPFNHTQGNNTPSSIQRELESQHDQDYMSYTQNYDDYDLEATESTNLNPNNTPKPQNKNKKFSTRLSKGWHNSNMPTSESRKNLIAFDGFSSANSPSSMYSDNHFANNRHFDSPISHSQSYANGFNQLNDNDHLLDMANSPSYPPFDYDRYSIRTGLGSMFHERAPSPPLPELPPGGVPSDNSKIISKELRRQNKLKNMNKPPPIAPFAATHPSVYYPQAGGGIAGPDSAAPNGVLYKNHRKQQTKLQRYMKMPWIVYILTVIQTIVFIVEFIQMGILTGSPIQTQPIFNPMIGPSSYVLINMGARFTPCMHGINNITNSPTLLFPCPNSTTATTNLCSLAELCGMGGGVLTPAQIDAAISSGATDANDAPLKPNQWWRFITPIFLHAGIIHLGFNMLLQVKLGGEIERNIGHIRFFIVYFAAGIGGFLLGGNFTPDGIASTGASGSLFGLIALDLLDLLFNWSVYENPYRTLILHIVEFVISFVIGLLPGLDNFSHIGGFCMGLVMGTAVLPSPRMLRKKKNDHLRMLKQDQALRNMELGEGGRFHDTNTNGAEYEDVSLTTFGDRSNRGNGGLVEEYKDELPATRPDDGSKKDNAFVTTRLTRTGGDGNGGSSSGGGQSSSSSSSSSTDTYVANTSKGRETAQPKNSQNLSRVDSSTIDPFASNAGSELPDGFRNEPPMHKRSGSGMLIHRRPRSWYTWMTVRIVCLGLVFAYFIGLILNFRRGGGNCSWCKYLSCLPVHGWCDLGNIQLSSTSSGNSGAAFGYMMIYFVHRMLFRDVKRR